MATYPPSDPTQSIEPLVSEPTGGTQRIQMTIARPDTVRRVVDVTTIARHVEGEIVVVQRCLGCGHIRRNRAAANDDRDALLALFGRPVPNPPR